MENKKLKNNKEDEFIKQFDYSFGTKLKEKTKETPLLINLFRNFIEQNFKGDNTYEKIIDEILCIEEDFTKNFTEEQKKLFDKWENCRDELQIYTTEQSFIYGYCFDKELTIERKEINKKELKLN